MKYIAVTLIAWTMSLGTAAAQNMTAAPDVLPQFPDGNQRMFSFINEQMTYSNEDKARKIEGEMIVTFMVDATGKLSDVEIKKGLSSAINTKILDVISRMPQWKPGQSRGQSVSARYSLAMVIQAHNQVARPLF